uniref:Uncharacterized protein n=1 Tax=Oryza meridionalis TaxID=40149 RepID=A0A0E0ELL6_9ORYZ
MASAGDWAGWRAGRRAAAAEAGWRPSAAEAGRRLAAAEAGWRPAATKGGMESGGGWRYAVLGSPP